MAAELGIAVVAFESTGGGFGAACDAATLIFGPVTVFTTGDGCDAIDLLFDTTSAVFFGGCALRFGGGIAVWEAVGICSDSALSCLPGEGELTNLSMSLMVLKPLSSS